MRCNKISFQELLDGFDNDRENKVWIWSIIYRKVTGNSE